MFAFVTLGDEYFAYGALAGLMSALVVGRDLRRCSATSSHDASTPRASRLPSSSGCCFTRCCIPTRADACKSASLPLTLLIFFAIILLGGIFQALFGLMRLGALIKFAPHPVMAGFQNMAAVLLVPGAASQRAGPTTTTFAFTAHLRADR